MAIGRRGGFITARFRGAAARRLKELRANARDLLPVAQAIGVDMHKSTVRNFRARGRRDEATGQWAPLSPVTLELRKAKKGVSGKGQGPLRATDELFRSLTPFGRVRGVKTQAGVSTTVPYAPDHQQGGRWGSAKRVRKTVQVQAHTRKQFVRRDTGRGAPRRGAGLGDRVSRYGENVTAGDILKRRRDATKRARVERNRGRVSPRRQPRSRAGLQRTEVRVKAHTQFWDVLVPARPFLWIHTKDRLKAARRLARWAKDRKKAS